MRLLLITLTSHATFFISHARWLLLIIVLYMILEEAKVLLHGILVHRQGTFTVIILVGLIIIFIWLILSLPRVQH